MKKVEPTISGKAIQTIEGFEKVYLTMQQQTLLRGQSKSTSVIQLNIQASHQGDKSKCLSMISNWNRI